MRKQTAESFWEKVDTSGDCWTWTLNTDKDGYGRVRWDGKYVRAHRLAYRLSTGVDPHGMFVCHRCDNPPCVRPDHLFLGDNQINQKDSVEKGRNHHAKITHCPAGHIYDGENTYLDPRGHRQCRECRHIRKVGSARTPADRCADGDHMWGFATDDPEDWFCVRGCGQRLPCRNFAISATGYRIPCVVTGKHHFHEFHSA